MSSTPLIDGFECFRLLETDVPLIQSAFDGDEAFFLENYGRSISVKEIITALPKGKSQDDKFLFSISSGGQIAGFIDILRGFPEDGVWYLGFLYILKPFRGGLGRATLRGLYSWVSARGGQSIRLSVVESNMKARHLYATEGFAFEVMREADPAANRFRRALVLQRRL